MYACSVSATNLKKYYDDKDVNAEFEEELPVRDKSIAKNFEQAVLKEFLLTEDNIVYWIYTRYTYNYCNLMSCNIIFSHC